MKSHPGLFSLIAVGEYRPKGASGMDEDKKCDLGAFVGLSFVVAVPVL